MGFGGSDNIAERLSPIIEEAAKKYAQAIKDGKIIRSTVQHDGCSEKYNHLEQQIKGWENSIKQYQLKASAASSAEEKAEYMRRISDREKWISSAKERLLNLKQDIEDIC